MGTGGLTGPGRRRTIVGGQGVSRSVTNMNNGQSAAPYETYGSPNAPNQKLGYGGGNMGIGMGSNSGVGGGPGGGLGAAPSVKDNTMSPRSMNTHPIDAQSMTSMGARSNAGAVTGGGPQTGMTDASAPLMTGSSGEPAEQPYSYRAKALYNCELCPLCFWFDVADASRR